MTLNTIKKEALHLSLKERAELAVTLLESLDNIEESEVEELWAKEAVRRAGEIDEGTVELVSAEELERRVQARFK